MNVSVLRSDNVSISSGSEVFPNEQLVYIATDFTFTGTQARFILKDSSGNIIDDRVVGTTIFKNEARMDAMAPEKEGVYVLVAHELNPFGGDVITSRSFSFVVSNDAPAKPKKNDPLSRISDILKWTAIGAGVIMVGYFVIQSGLLSKSAKLTRRAIAENPHKRRR